MTEPTMSYIEKNVKNIASVYRLAHQDCHVHENFISHPAGLTLQGTIEAMHVHSFGEKATRCTRELMHLTNMPLL